MPHSSVCSSPRLTSLQGTPLLRAGLRVKKTSRKWEEGAIPCRLTVANGEGHFSLCRLPLPPKMPGLCLSCCLTLQAISTGNSVPTRATGQTGIAVPLCAVLVFPSLQPVTENLDHPVHTQLISREYLFPQQTTANSNHKVKSTHLGLQTGLSSKALA